MSQCPARVIAIKIDGEIVDSIPSLVGITQAQVDEQSYIDDLKKSLNIPEETNLTCEVFTMEQAIQYKKDLENSNE